MSAALEDGAAWPRASPDTAQRAASARPVTAIQSTHAHLARWEESVENAVMGLPKIDWRLLTDDERLQLLDQAWESFRELPESLPLPQSHRDELDRRQAALDEGRMPMRSWEEVREEIRRKLRHDP